MFISLASRSALLLTLLASVSSQAADAPDLLFAETSMLKFELSGPFTLIDRERDKEKEYEGTLTYRQADGSTLELDVEYQVRGNYRLRDDICEYSQLWVNLKKSQVKGTLFDNQNKLKLVVQCDDLERYQGYIMREEQAYRLFNVLSPMSFRSRLAEITYTDPANSDAQRMQLGFFIEHQENLASRLGLAEVDRHEVARSELDATQANLVAWFMFMISNTDFSVLIGPDGEDCCHNAKLFADSANVLYASPYDFDSTGYVNASYATPSEGLNQSSVRVRVFRGFCVDDTITQSTIKLFNSKREELNGIIRDAAFQSEREVERTQQYVDEFFDIINDTQRLKRNVLDKCRG